MSVVVSYGGGWSEGGHAHILHHVHDARSRVLLLGIGLLSVLLRRQLAPLLIGILTLDLQTERAGG